MESVISSGNPLRRRLHEYIEQPYVQRTIIALIPDLCW